VKHIITVDDEPGLADYTSIQDALNHSNPGDTIEVYSGMFNEGNLNITVKNLTLQGIPYDLPGGDDTGKPCVHDNDTPGNVFDVHANGVSIIGFRIWEPCSSYGACDICIFSDNCLVSNNDFNSIHDGNGEIDMGIWVRSGNHSLITHNNFSQCIGAIYLAGNYNIVDNNLINLSGMGIEATGSYQRISNNTIDEPNQYCIEIGGTHFNITGNNIIRCDCGIRFKHANNYIIIFRNNFKYNNLGIEAYGDYLEMVSNNVITQNNFINNKHSIILQMSILTGHFRLDGNYFSDWNGKTPKIIWGSKIVFMLFVLIGFIPISMPWLFFDWHPAKQPYDITTGGFQ
jgi:hypothetical protein